MSYFSRGDLEEVCKELGIEENISEVIEQLGDGETGKISYESFCRNKSLLVHEMNTGQTSSSDSNSAPEFSTDTESNLNRISGSKQKKNTPESKAEKLGRSVTVLVCYRLYESN